MATQKSPPLAFQPSPETILRNSNKENFLPIFDKFQMGSIGAAHDTNGVQFSPPLTSLTRRAQSLATSVPLLDPISSASRIPPPSSRSKHTTSNIDLQAYIEQSRSLLEGQRIHFEKERYFFEEERKLWGTERTMLLSQIADLEFKLNKANGAMNNKRTSIDQGTKSSVESNRASFSITSSRDGSQDRGPAVEPKVWESPDMGAPVTRVFSNESHAAKRPDIHLPSIAEAPNSPLQLDDTLSPLVKVDSKTRSVSIPIEKIDSSLDGITLKSTSLPHSLVKTIVSPTSPSPLSISSPATRPKDDNTRPVISEKLSLSPFTENLTKHAGHTPMAVDPISEKSSNSDEKADKHSPRSMDTEKPYCPEPTLRPPTERSNSYFTGVEAEKEGIDDDPELRGPLIMDSTNSAPDDNVFLSELDRKLAAEVEKAESPIRTRDPSEGEEQADPGLSNAEDEGLKLRIKRSTNFGSAWGSSACGKNV